MPPRTNSKKKKTPHPHPIETAHLPPTETAQPLPVEIEEEHEENFPPPPETAPPAPVGIEEENEEITLPPPTENQEQRSPLSHPQDNDEDTQPIPPKFYLDQSNYTKWCRLSSRSEENNTIAALNNILEEDEKKWFRLHPQFQHIWHMHREENHKYTGMWLLLLRTVCMDKDRICWFVVNGVPIRYSLREHGIMCGLDCRIYPPNYKSLGSEEFVKRNFGQEEEEEEKEQAQKKIVVRIMDVKEKLCSMQACGDRLKMAILLFLSTIIAPSKKYGYIDSFLLRIVDDVDACETFPWGRYTFDDTITNIFHMMNRFKGRVNVSWCFPGFLTPLEILACECIPNLKSSFRVDVEGANTSCPRMCKQKWRDSHMKGYPIEDVNSALGSTTEIHSILEPELSEVSLMASITEDDEIQSSDPLAVSWERRLCVENKKIWWKELRDLDVASRGRNIIEEHQEEEIIPPQSARAVNTLKSLESKLMRTINAGFKVLNKKIEKKYNLLNRRVTDMELCVKDVLNKDRGLNFEKDALNKGRWLNFEKDASLDGEIGNGFEKEALVDGEMGTEFEKDASVYYEIRTRFDKDLSVDGEEDEATGEEKAQEEVKGDDEINEEEEKAADEEEEEAAGDDEMDEEEEAGGGDEMAEEEENASGEEEVSSKLKTCSKREW